MKPLRRSGRQPSVPPFPEKVRVSGQHAAMKTARQNSRRESEKRAADKASAALFLCRRMGCVSGLAEVRGRTTSRSLPLLGKVAERSEVGGGRSPPAPRWSCRVRLFPCSTLNLPFQHGRTSSPARKLAWPHRGTPGLPRHPCAGANAAPATKARGFTP